MISSTGATPLGSPSGWKSLVAGNVTGGGGKATKKRPNGTGRESVTKRVINLGADRDHTLRRGGLGIQTRWFERVHARATKPLRSLR